MELREIVSAHDPDQAHTGSPATQICNRVDGIAGSNDSFETTDVDTGIVSHLARGLDALVQVVQAAMILERITRGHQPPDTIEVQAFEREQADGAMCRMRRI